MTTARRGVSMVRAQVTAWSERRSQAGATVVIVGVPPPVRAVLLRAVLRFVAVLFVECAKGVDEVDGL